MTKHKRQSRSKDFFKQQNNKRLSQKVRSKIFETIANFVLIAAAVGCSDYLSFFFWSLFN